jgi:DNA-binding transcriptional LysR family regulator
MLDARRLTVLREVARTGKISAAASALDFTASAVSQQLRSLELEVGIPLLERSARSVRLTEAGRVLAEHATRVIAELEAAERAAHAVAGLRGGRLRLASFATAGASFVPAVLAAFRDRNPDVSLTMVEMEPEDALPRLRSGELDVAVTHQYTKLSAPDLRGLTQALLFREPLLLALRAADADQMGPDPVDLRSLASATWIGTRPASGFQAHTETSCRAAGFEPQISHRVDTYTMVLTMVAAGLGVALVPGLATMPLEGVAFRAIRSPASLQREVQLTSRRDDPSAAVAEIIALGKQVCASDAHIGRARATAG